MISTKSIPAGTEVAFRITNRLPLFREVYGSNQAGTAVVTGVIRQKARLLPLDGSEYRLGSAQKLPEAKLRFPLRRRRPRGTGDQYWVYTDRVSPEKRNHRAAYETVIAGTEYRLIQQHAGRRGFDIWDGTESLCLATTDPGRAIQVHRDLPAVLVLLLPWLDNQVVAS